MDKSDLLAALYLSKDQSIKFKKAEDCLEQFEKAKKQFDEIISKQKQSNWGIGNGKI